MAIVIEKTFRISAVNLPEAIVNNNNYTMTANASKIACAEDFRDLAKITLPTMYFDYVEGGAEREWTVHDNEEAFRR